MLITPAVLSDKINYSTAISSFKDKKGGRTNLSRKIKKSRGIAFIVAVVLILTSAIGANTIMTSSGKVEIIDCRAETPYGTLSLLIYKPESATAENPAPCVISSHGILNSREMQDMTQVELSRRGIVSISMDMFSHGHSSTTQAINYIINEDGQYLKVEEGNGSFVASPEEASSWNAEGMIQAVEYVWENLDYVDHDKIGLSGHSYGGQNVNYTVQYYTYQEMYGDGLNKVSAGLVEANTLSACTYWDYHGTNMGTLAGSYDEFFQLSARAMGLTNQQLVDYLAAAFIAVGTADATVMETGYQYGTPVYSPEGKLRIAYNPTETHAWNTFSNETGSYIVNFFETAWGLDSGLSQSDMIWGFKEAFNGIGLIGFFLLVISAACAAADLKFFRSACTVNESGKAEIPMRRAAAGKKQKLAFWGVTVILAAIPGLTYFSFMHLGAKWMPSAVFPMYIANEISTWAALNGIIALALVFAAFFLFDRKDGETVRLLGVIPAGERLGGKIVSLLKSLLLAAIAVGLGYVALYICDALFKTDFRIYTTAVKTFSADKLLCLLAYLPFFLIWSYGNNIAVNSIFREGKAEWKGMILSICTNIIGVLAVLLIYYCSYYANGLPLFAESLNPILLYPFIILLPVAAAAARLLYKKTGNVYAGTFFNAIMLCMITVANTQTHFISSGVFSPM